MDCHDFRRKAGLFAHGLPHGGENALTHFGVTGHDFEAPTFQHANQRVAAIDGAVADACALDAAADARIFRALVDILDGFETAPDARGARPHDLAGGESIAGVQNISLTNIPAVYADFFGEDIHDAFDGEMSLIGAEAAHGAAGGIICEDSLGFDIHVRHAVRSAGMAGGAKQAFAAGARVASGITDDSNPRGEQVAFGIDAHSVVQRHRMALGMELGGLLARKNCFHRTSQQVRGERGLGLDGQLFFGAESTARGSQLDFHFFRRQIQNFGDLSFVEGRALALREKFDAFSLGECQASFGLQKRRIDRLGLECVLDDMGRRCERSIYIAAGKSGGFEQVGMDVQISGGMHLRRSRL